MKSLKYLVYLVCLIFTANTFTACDDDDNKQDTTPISIKQIYLQDTESSVQDRPVEYVRLGQTIRIEGSGLLGMKKVYINGYDTYFNQAMMTDNNMWLQLNSKTPVIDADEDVRNKIKFVKSGAETTIDFIIRAASPRVSGVSNSLPQPGELVYVYGSNLHETAKVTLPGGTEITTGITSHIDGEWYSFKMPEGVTAGGSVYSEGANGIAATPAYFNNTDCMVLDFDGKGTQGSWSWTETGSMMNADDLADDPANSGRGKCAQLIPQRLLDAGGIAAGKPRASEIWTAGNDDAMDDWSRMFSYIPATTPIDEIALQFDILVPEAWEGSGHIEILLINNYNFGGIGSDDDGGYTAFVVPYIKDGKIEPFKTAGWTTITIPLSEFGYFAKNAEETDFIFQHVVDARNSASYRNFGMGFVNTDFSYGGVDVASVTASPKIYADNWRIVPCAAIEISDYPEDEE
ncbi:glycan-binding surface protein [Bacteroides sp. 519]|uniref:glycan-binding surface protein n=1 Tax=Bacteroides sp. 519 TaxID=2302937 RepID=UPI0013D0BC43|nr:glycan-binding surface protein [Bacteroides sp. 519]NDV60209.1 hypothetical protein [Bacteroides sp. 519]